MLDRILMVCTGNICRSPMAEALLRDRFAARGRGTVASAGLAALVGRPADPLALELLAARGLDLSAHRARQLTPEMVAEADLVIVMEAAHQQELERLSRAARGRVHRLGRFGGFDVEDPYRAPREAFERALAQIERGLDDFGRTFWAVSP
jgi:protein-tyrosine phosphatase